MCINGGPGFVTDQESDIPELSPSARKLRQKTHQTIARITENFESGQFNTPVAALMELNNSLYDFNVKPETAEKSDRFVVTEAIRSLILMLTPYAPHTCEELWEVVTGSDAGIIASGARFPVADEEAAKEDELEIAVQINGKLRARISSPPDVANDVLEGIARSDDKVREYTDGMTIVKVIVIPNRLVNIVVKP